VGARKIVRGKNLICYQGEREEDGGHRKEVGKRGKSLGREDRHFLRRYRRSKRINETKQKTGKGGKEEWVSWINLKKMWGSSRESSGKGSRSFAIGQ